MSENTADLVSLSADIVSAFVSNNNVPLAELPALISSTHAALASLGKEPVPTPPVERPVPAVPIKKSITADYLVCLEDGKQFKSLKRHLRTAYDMTPEDYRNKWGLPGDYPMVAPSYAESRSNLAKSMGLGQKARKGSRDKAKAARGA